MNYREWYVGMRVVCIFDDWYGMNGIKTEDANLPVKDTVYTIRMINMKHDLVFIMLQEIENPLMTDCFGYVGEMQFDARSFKPVDETKLDQFRKHLVKRPETVNA